MTLNIPRSGPWIFIPNGSEGSPDVHNDFGVTKISALALRPFTFAMIGKWPLLYA